MKATPATGFGFFGSAMKLPFHLFADEDDRVLSRLDEMHKSMPQTLPEKRFFRH